MRSVKHIVPLIAAILAAAVLFIATPHGIGITSDSIVYITVARSIVSGHGWTFFGAPVTLWPSLYPSLLSVAGLIGFDVIEGARWLQIVIWGWNIFWIGFIAFRFSRGSIAASLAACCLTLGAVDLL